MYNIPQGNRMYLTFEDISTYVVVEDMESKQINVELIAYHHSILIHDLDRYKVTNTPG